MTIPLNLPALACQTPITVHKAYLQIEESYIKYFVWFLADEPVDPEDLKGSWERKERYNDIVIRKSDITGTEMGRSNYGKWYVKIYAKAQPDSVTLYFRTRTKGNEMKDLLDLNIFGIHPPQIDNQTHL